MRSRTSCEVAEEAKENWFLDTVVESTDENSSESPPPPVSSGMEVVEDPFAGLEEGMHEGGRGG